MDKDIEAIILRLRGIEACHILLEGREDPKDELHQAAHIVQLALLNEAKFWLDAIAEGIAEPLI